MPTKRAWRPCASPLWLANDATIARQLNFQKVDSVHLTMRELHPDMDQACAASKLLPRDKVLDDPCAAYHAEVFFSSEGGMRGTVLGVETWEGDERRRFPFLESGGSLNGPKSLFSELSFL